MESSSSNNPGIKRRTGYITALILGVAALSLLGSAPPAPCEPYLRVCKNGVIYYYFSNCQVNSSSQTLPGPQRIQPRPPLTQGRLSPQELEGLIQEASRCHNLPAPLVKAVIRVESNFNAAAQSPKGAQGLMQLMPGTADELMVSDPYDPRENIWGGVRYLRMLLDKFNNRLHLALAAYNAGPQRVSQYQQVPAIQETQGFVYDVCTQFLKYSGEQRTINKASLGTPPTAGINLPNNLGTLTKDQKP